MFYDSLAVYNKFGGAVLVGEEGKRLAAALGRSKRNLILQNHGILTAGGTVAEAVGFFIALERACHTQLVTDAAAANGIPKTFVSDEVAAFTSKTTSSPEVMYAQFWPEYSLLLKDTGEDFLS
jgi:ribulose-5-phosphate 4-epimerase/fuculose-1-phosphate aldolase